MRILGLPVLFGAIALIVTGCTGVTVNQEALKSIKKAAIIGVYTKQLRGKDVSDANNKALKKMLDDSATVLAAELKANCGWEVMDLKATTASPAYKDATAKLKEVVAFDRWSKEHSKKYIAPDSQYFIHKGYLMSPGEVVGTDEAAAIEAVKSICKGLDVDAVIILYPATWIGNATDFRVSVGKGRTYGYIKYNPSLAIMNKNGEAVISLGSNNLDDLAPTKHSVPIYKGNSTTNFYLDLDHEGVWKAFEILEKKTLNKISRKIKKNIP